MLFLESDSPQRWSIILNPIFFFGRGGGRNSVWKYIDSISLELSAFRNQVEELWFLLRYSGVMPDNPCEYWMATIILVQNGRLLYTFLHFGTLKKNCHFPRSVTDERHLISKSIRELLSRILYPEQFSITVFFLKKPRITKIYAENGFLELFKPPCPISQTRNSLNRYVKFS